MNTKNQTKKKPAPRKISSKYLRNAGLHYLKRYTSSSENFRRVLMRKINRSCKFHTEQDMEECIKLLGEIVSEFEERGYLNDELYTYGMVVSLRRGGKSRRSIEAKLKQKGLTSDIINENLNKYEEEFGEEINIELISAVRHARKKRLGCFSTKSAIPEQSTEEHAKARQKQLASLARAGFSYDIASQALQMNEEEASQLIGSLD